MMKRLLGSYAARFIVFLWIGCILAASAAAEGGPSLNPMLDKWLQRVENGEATDITLSAAIHALSPYGDDTVAAINCLLAECSVHVGYQQTANGETTAARIIIGQMPAVDFVTRSDGQMQAQTSLLPGVTLESGTGSPMDILLGQSEDIPFWASDILDPNGLADMIPDVLSGLSSFKEEKTGSYHLSSIGTAKKAVVYTVPEGGAQMLREGLSLLAGRMNYHEAAALIHTMTLTGDAVITLYQTAEGKSMGLGIKATMGFENTTPREVTFLWVFKSDEKKCLHEISLKAPADKGSDNLTITGELTLESLKAKNRLSFSLDVRNKVSGKPERAQWSGQLDCLLAEDNQRLEGEIKQTYTDPEETAHILTIKPSLLTYQVGDAFSVKGNARILWSRNKKVVTDVTFSLLAGATEDIPWEESGRRISLDGLGETDLIALREQALAKAAESIWKSVLALPEDCLKLISRNISQEDWARIYQDAYVVGQ